MMPRTIFRRDAARATGTCDKTITALLGLPCNRESEKVSLSKLAKVLRADPAWIMDCVDGRDSAISEQHAKSVIGGTGHAQPRAHLRKGRRYSAVDLGLMRPGPSVCGHPSSNQPHMGGNSMED